MAGNTLEVHKAIKKKIEREFRTASYTVKSAGFKQDGLSEPLSNQTGYWKEPQRVASKPPRWVIQFEAIDGEVTATFAAKQDGSYFPSANTIGYINNREGNCAAILCRIIASIKIDDEKFVFPEWEWVLILIFHKPLPVGNSSETITNINPQEGSIDYQRNSYKYALLGLVKTDVESPFFTDEANIQMSYEQASEALGQLMLPDIEVK